MISQFFILTTRGDILITKDYRGDIPKGTSEIFFRKIREGGDLPPVFKVDDVNFMFIRRGGLYLVITSLTSDTPSFIMELLERIAKVFKDFCGLLNEEAIRKNFILVYEILDEVIDAGVPQCTTTDILKTCIHNPAVLILPKSGSSGKVGGSKTISSAAVHKPVAAQGSKGKNQIFIDILEKLTILFSSNGRIVNSAIDGMIQMKSYLHNNPPLRLALNEDLVVGKGGSTGYGAVSLDSTSFHDQVNLDDFESLRTLTFQPPEGEFTLMNYRMKSEYRAPFRVFPFVEEISPTKIEFVLKIRADIPEKNHGVNVLAQFTVPQTVGSVSIEKDNSSAIQVAEYREKLGKVLWQVKKFQGGSEHRLVARLSLKKPCTGNIRKLIGPVSLTFEIPMYNVSRVNVRYLKIADSRVKEAPQRWVRYVTQSNSYVCRL
eukprot:TRINITY_DN2728_c0_g1_i1.p1 TRINITY_DN2728_c0_g1~~TRINITY_DN2728_c0_g1_i1.p1  ORF type:complete len:432 (+),score=126.24 TRINITY_DN2728_c0_g1_i1:1135-2430(+)